MTPATLSADQERLLTALASALAGARADGDCRRLIAEMARTQALLPALPAAFEPVLQGISQRLESSAAFGEESCSFSLTDLYNSLDTWIARARLRLTEAARAASSRA